MSKRGTTVLRDDFDASSLNTGEWDYEISMYGGYVSFVHGYSDTMYGWIECFIIVFCSTCLWEFSACLDVVFRVFSCRSLERESCLFLQQKK